ncbi:hypothetical protein M2451_001037 [Dysgonomonas sp. PFB1-18]|nr:hypothetical protein [Dysgonomonas sp. PF1-14]MDH6338223.1 hypothetical protein [Dysgonomonas sp. PF1-16]MDH6379720.1 hypothetical protein [Dysgonomonas sp. PFB1-18]MDH6397191.1 hypothetical protein [Dysgonomonas sp. PF1-23]
MQKFRIMFLPDSIDLGQSEKYILTIRLTPAGFMFSISDPGNGKNYCLRETTFSLKDNSLSDIQRIIFDLNFLTQEFKQTNVIIVSKDYELIPADYYNGKKQPDFYDLTHTSKAGHLLSGLIVKQDVIVSYSVEEEIHNFLSRNLWDPHFFHHSHLMIDFFAEKGHLMGPTPRMYLYFHDGYMDVVCFAGQKLIHSLTYESEPAANQLYFILKLWEGCGFDQLTDYLFIAGTAEELLVAQLREYIKNIEFINTPSEVYLWNEDAQRAPLDILTLAL